MGKPWVPVSCHYHWHSGNSRDPFTPMDGGTGAVFTFESSFQKKKQQQQAEKKSNSSTAHSEEEQILIKGCVSGFPNSFVYASSALDFKKNRTLHYYKTKPLSLFLVKKIMCIY